MATINGGSIAVSMPSDLNFLDLLQTVCKRSFENTSDQETIGDKVTKFDPETAQSTLQQRGNQVDVSILPPLLPLQRQPISGSSLFTPLSRGRLMSSISFDDEMLVMAAHDYDQSRIDGIDGEYRRHASRQHRTLLLDALLPSPCFAYSTVSGGDDDDVTSMNTSFPLAVHCSGANLTAIPSLLPSSAIFLHFGHNQISYIPPNSFANNTALVKLVLFDNLLTSLVSGLFDTLTALVTLYLYNNIITSLSPGIFSNLSRFQFLSFGNNVICEM